MSEIKLTADSGGGSTSLKGPASSGVDTAFVLPSADGSTGQFIKTDGSKNLSFASVSSTPEGTAILSTGESGGTKFLREDGDGTCSWQAAGGGKVLQFKYTQTRIADASGNWDWPTTETDLSGHSIAMTKQSSGTSYYHFNLTTSVHYGSGSIDARFYLYKDSTLLDDQSDVRGWAYMHSPTASVNAQIHHSMVLASDSGTYKLRVKAGSSNFQLAVGCYTTFTITEFE